MNGVQNREVHIIHKPFPGCLGRMLNLFDIAAGVTGNKLLTDKTHRDASTLSRSLPYVSRMSGPPYADRMENEKVHQYTPMKMLIDEEMTREVHVKHNSPTVVAKLMGIDTFPKSQPTSAASRSNSSYYPGRCGLVDTPSQCWPASDGVVDKGTILDDISQCSEHDNCRVIYETWQRSPSSSNVVDNTRKKGKCSEDINRKKMDLVRQKFDEAKHLSTSGKLRQSKEFEDALDVLSSNQDLLLEIMQESNPISHKNLFDLNSTAHPGTKRITVLRPTRVVDNERISRSGKVNFQHMPKVDCTNSAVIWNKNDLPFTPTNKKLNEQHIQPTHIVVLKPSPNRTSDLRDAASPFPPSPRILPIRDISMELEDGVTLELQKLAQGITREMLRSPVGHGTNETLYSMILSNGYNGDDSSSEKSEIEYSVGNLSDLEVTSLSPRLSRDHVNGFGSPYSSSPLSRASRSPGSSVCREAKKRLSERWTLMASNGSSQEQRLGHRRSSTLGEMLALSDTKKTIISENGSNGKYQGPWESISCSGSYINEACSPKSLQRSKSLPSSSNTHDSLDFQGSDHEVGKAQILKELKKARNTRSSLTGKVSSLIFSRKQKSNKEDASSSSSQSNNESQLDVGTLTSAANVPGIVRNEAFISCADNSLKVSSNISRKHPPDLNHQKGVISHRQPGLSVSGTVMTALSHNQNQRSPLSILDTPFEEDENAITGSWAMIKSHQLGPSVLNKSNLIDKSPPIGSIARILHRDSSHAEEATPYPVTTSTVPLDIREDEDDLLSCVHDLLSQAGLDEQMSSDSFFCKWHSSESTSDPSFSDKFATVYGREPLQEAKRKQKRSKQRLVFDCVNAALEEITGYSSEKHPASRKYSRGISISSECTTPILADVIVGRMKELLSSKQSCEWEDHDGDCDCLVESAVREEIVGRGWCDLLRSDMDSFGEEIEGKLVEELVKEAMDDLIHTM